MTSINVYFLAGQSNANFLLSIAIKQNAFLVDGETAYVCQNNLGGQHSTMWIDENGQKGPRWDIDIQKFAECVDYLENENITPVFKGFIWWQGERDTLEIETTVEQYEARLARYIDDIRAHFLDKWPDYSRDMVFVDMLIGINQRATSFNDQLMENVVAVRDAKRCVSAARNWLINIETQHYVRVDENRNHDLWHPSVDYNSEIAHDIVNGIYAHQCI